MPKPTLSDLHVDRALTNVSVNWIQQRDNFVCTAFNNVNSDFQSDKYHVWSREDILRTEAEKVGPGGMAPIRGEGLTQATFSCDVWKVREMLDQQRTNNADPALALRETATLNCTNDVMTRIDADWASELFVSGVWATDTTPANLWDDQTNGTPIEDIRTAVRTVASATGYKPNVMVMGPAVWDALTDHPQFTDRIKYTQTGIVGPELLASLFGFDKVVVAEAVRNTAAEGATEATSHILGKNALVAYKPDAASLNTPSAWYTFVWSGLIGSNMGMRIRNYNLPERDNSEVIEAEAAYDHKVVSSDLGYFFDAVVS